MTPLMSIIALLILVETDGHPNPKDGDGGKAVGPLQIHAVMVKEANRILGRPFFVNTDRKDRRRSVEIAYTFLDHQRERYFDKHGKYPDDLTLMCSWNTGSISKAKPAEYMQRVHAVITREEAKRKKAKDE